MWVPEGVNKHHSGGQGMMDSFLTKEKKEEREKILNDSSVSPSSSPSSTDVKEYPGFSPNESPMWLFSSAYPPRSLLQSIDSDISKQTGKNIRVHHASCPRACTYLLLHETNFPLSRNWRITCFCLSFSFFDHSPDDDGMPVLTENLNRSSKRKKTMHFSYPSKPVIPLKFSGWKGDGRNDKANKNRHKMHEKRNRKSNRNNKQNNNQEGGIREALMKGRKGKSIGRVNGRGRGMKFCTTACEGPRSRYAAKVFISI